MLAVVVAASGGNATSKLVESLMGDRSARTSSLKRESSRLHVAFSSQRRALAEARKWQREAVLRLQDRAMVVDGCLLGCCVWCVGRSEHFKDISLKVGKIDASLFLAGLGVLT